MEPDFKKLANDLLVYTAPEHLPFKLEALLREMYELGLPVAEKRGDFTYYRTHSDPSEYLRHDPKKVRLSPAFLEAVRDECFDGPFALRPRDLYRE